MKYEAEEFKKLIKNGFDLELISFEFDIPMEQLQEYKKEIESKKPKISAKDIIDKRNNHAHLCMEKMRRKYKALYLGNSKEEVKQQEKLTEQEVEVINSVIALVEEKIEQIKNMKKAEKRPIVIDILEQIKKVEDYPLTIEQLEKLNSIINSEELLPKSEKVYESNKIDLYIAKTRSKINKKLIETIDIACYNTESIEELEELQKKLRTTITKGNLILADAVIRKIQEKISKINIASKMNEVKNNISSNILSIIADLANGTIDINKANEIITKEAKRMVESKPKTKFALTEEQQKRNILIQIRTAIVENANKYHIQNPEQAVLQLKELCGGTLGHNITAVVDNLIARKSFEEAKELCDKFHANFKQEETLMYIKNLKRKIKNAQLSDIVLKGINMTATIEEERVFFDRIEEGIQMGNVKLSAVSLGKSKDGLRNITLEDVWSDENNKAIEKDL